MNFQQHYNSAIDIIGHLILTKPTPVIKLLMKHGVEFQTEPTRSILIDGVVELLKDNDAAFQKDLSQLLGIHVKHQGKVMLKLADAEANNYMEEDEDAFFGSIVKSVVGGLFKRRPRRSSSGGGSNAAAQAAAAQARAQARMQAAQAAQAKRDMERRMREMERRNQEAAERRRMEAEQQRRQLEAQAAAQKRRSNTTLMAVGGVALFAVLGIFLTKSNSKPPMPYMSPAPVMAR